MLSAVSHTTMRVFSESFLSPLRALDTVLIEKPVFSAMSLSITLINYRLAPILSKSKENQIFLYFVYSYTVNVNPDVTFAYKY